jgi:hypothetical protein
LLAFAPPLECNANAANHRTLRVALYPFVPDKDDLFARVKSSFEHRHPDIALTIIDLSGNYYDESSPGAITNTDADILEVDSVFLDDLVAAGCVQALRASVVPDKALFTPIARGAMDVGWNTYSIPHWLCTSYLFVASQDVLARAKSFDEEGALARPGFSTFAWRLRRNGSNHATQNSRDTHVARVLTNLRRMYCSECLATRTITALTPPVAQGGARPFARVHGFMVAKSCMGLCLADAELFVTEVTSAKRVRAV